MSEPRRLSVGVGLTNACNLACPHCYRPRGEATFLPARTVLRCLDRWPAASVNLGTGENILHPELTALLDALAERDVPVSLTSNGTSLLELDAERLARLHDVEVSFDFATRAEMDAFRGRGAWQRAVRAVERCVALGRPVTILAVLMSINHDRLADVARLARQLGARCRVNVYQPVHDRRYLPDRAQFWEAFRRLLGETWLVTCTEGVVLAALDGAAGEAPVGGCGRASVRITPSGELLPCVYWPESAGQADDVAAADFATLCQTPPFVQCRSIPAPCRDCPAVQHCRGGCASRRMRTGGPDAVDPYCPRATQPPVRLHAQRVEDVDLLHAANVCTTIVRAPD